MSLPSATIAVEPPKTDAEQALVGKVFARKFKLLRLLGAGGMGAVYEAVDLLLGRHVAVKLMKPAIATNNALVQRFVREARAADSIQHKNIVRVLDLASDEETGSFYIVQELLHGESLAEKLEREGSLTTSESIAIVGPVLDALAAAHERGIVHRDVKPENIFLHREADQTITPKLIDFGISKVAEGGAGLAKTQTGTALGTPYYMSPEQVRGDSSIDHRADQWSAGIVLFELVAGRRPFLGENYNLLILEIMTRRAPRADEVASGVRSDVATVIARALEPNRDDRFESTAAFRLALDALPLDDDASRVSKPRVRSEHALREDSPTIDAEAPSSDPKLVLAATIAAETSEALPLVAARDASETRASAIAEAKKSEESPVISSAKRPAPRALLVGAALAAVVSVAAVASLSRSNASSPARSTPVVSAEHSESRVVLRAAQPAQDPVSSRVASAQSAADAGSIASDTTLSASVQRPNTAAIAPRVRTGRAVAQGAQSSRGTTVTATAATTNVAQNTQQNPTQNTQSSGSAAAGTSATTTSNGGGFRPITTYAP